MSDVWSFGEAIQEPTVRQGKWPHKCDTCGRFVSHRDIRHSRDSEGEYWATAHCAHCQKRVNVNPI